MRLNDIKENAGAHNPRKRVGRGMASGTGKTSGSGHKGQKARSGVSLLGFEGGQMPLYRRLPKRGFNNPFSKDFAELTLKTLESAIASGKIDAKKPVTEEVLRAASVVRKSRDGVRLLATGEIKSKVTIEITGATKGAIAAVEKAGGKVTVAEAKVKPEGKGKARHRKFKEGAQPAKAAAPATETNDAPKEKKSAKAVEPAKDEDK
ncbi:MAG: 50S ribosomal protein L15 [Alphaproteobacteria bacterium]|jgi:large subunit ribosomal protein L15|nr:50S ribosomal protein L15 [Alphaproteobacteria bacterium]